MNRAAGSKGVSVRESAKALVRRRRLQDLCKRPPPDTRSAIPSSRVLSQRTAAGAPRRNRQTRPETCSTETSHQSSRSQTSCPTQVLSQSALSKASQNHCCGVAHHSAPLQLDQAQCRRATWWSICNVSQSFAGVPGRAHVVAHRRTYSSTVVCRNEERPTIVRS